MWRWGRFLAQGFFLANLACRQAGAQRAQSLFTTEARRHGGLFYRRPCLPAGGGAKGATISALFLSFSALKLNFSASFFKISASFVNFSALFFSFSALKLRFSRDYLDRKAENTAVVVEDVLTTVIVLNPFVIP